MPPRRASLPFNHRTEKALVALQAAIDPGAAIKATFRLLKSAVPCDFVNVCLRNVREDTRQLSYRMIDSRGREFDPAFLENEFFREHPGMPLLMANPGIRFINTRETLPPEKILRKSRFYREAMRLIGFRHAVGIFFWSDPPQAPEAIFSVLRAEGRPDFADAEVAIFERLYPHIDAMLHRIEVMEQERAIHREMRSLARKITRSACVLDWSLTVADAGKPARESCANWNLGAAGHHLKTPPFKLPPQVRAACLRLKSDWQASLRRLPDLGKAARLVVRHPANPHLFATVALHRPTGRLIGKPSFLIEFENPPVAKGPAPSAGRAVLSSLSSRERELVGWICEGLSNQEIAVLSGRALGTIKNALHRLFLKLHVHSRGMLVALVRGTVAWPAAKIRSGSS